MSKASVVPHLVLVAAAVGALALDAATAKADGIPGVVMTDAQNVTDWSGFYIGGRLGGAWGDVNWSEDSPAFGTTAGASFSPSGFAGGVFGGANLQLGQWIFGLEASYSARFLNVPARRFGILSRSGSAGDRRGASATRGTACSCSARVVGQATAVV
jgi:outer membrane immunogenic protein